MKNSRQSDILYKEQTMKYPNNLSYQESHTCSKACTKKEKVSRSCVRKLVVSYVYAFAVPIKKTYIPSP